MEGTPLIAEGDAESEESRRQKERERRAARTPEASRQPEAPHPPEAKKPERFGMLAVESDDEPGEPEKPERLSPLKAALARSRRTLEGGDAPAVPEKPAEAEKPAEPEAASEVPAAPEAPLELPAPPPVELLEPAEPEPLITAEAEPPAPSEQPEPAREPERPEPASDVAAERELRIEHTPEPEPAAGPELPAARTEPAVREEVAPSQPQPEAEAPEAAEREQTSEQAPGYIGHALFTTETAPAAPAPEAAPAARAGEAGAKPEAAPTDQLAGRRIESLARDDLLKLAENIRIDGDSLRHLYETHLIGERGLRRLVQAHQEGGDMHKALGEELTEREKDFERDPAMRDVSGDDAPVALPASSANASLDQMLHAADPVSAAGAAATAAATGVIEQAAFQKARTEYEAASQQRTRYRLLIDAAFFGLIAVLAIVVAIIYIVR